MGYVYGKQRSTSRVGINSGGETRSPEKEEGVMKWNTITVIGAVIFSVAWMLAASAPPDRPLPKRGDRVTVEGEITYVQTKGPAIWGLKTADGNAYRIQIPFGMIAELKRAGFDPKAGDTIRAAGEIVCVLAETPVVARHL
jgi:hypothetical protein